MKDWLKKYLKPDGIRRSFSELRDAASIGCGFISKITENYYNLVCDDYALVYLISGSGTFVDRNGKEYRIKAGDAFQRMPDYKHSSTVDPDSNYWELYLSIGRRGYQHLIDIGTVNPEIPVWHGELKRDWVDRVWRLMERLKQAEYIDGSQATLSMYQLINDLRLYSEGSTFGKDERIIHGMEQLRLNSCNHLPLKEIARKSGMSNERFRKVFKEQTGISPGQYRIRCRIDMARSKLETSRLPLEEIAMQLGYPDVYSFSKQFRQQTGMSPGRYRN